MRDRGFPLRECWNCETESFEIVFGTHVAGLVPVIEVTYYCHTLSVGYPFTNLKQNVNGFHSINTINTVTYNVLYFLPF